MESLHSLTSLQLSNSGCSPDDIVHLISCLPHLRAVRLAVASFNSTHLDSICQARAEVREVDLRGCGVVSFEALSHLSGLTNLAIAKGARMPHAALRRSQPFALPSLPHLARLRASGWDFCPAVLEAAAALAALTYLHIGQDDVPSIYLQSDIRKSPVSAALVTLASCHLLASLNVSCLRIDCDQVESLLSRMPQLRAVCIRGCPDASSTRVAHLAASHPACHVHTQFY